MAQEKPSPQLGFDEVCIEVPVANRYPTVPPPHPASTESGSGSELSQKQNPPPHWADELPCVVALLSIIFVMVYLAFMDQPSFKVESALVSLHKYNDSSRATWNMGLRVKDGRFFHRFDFNDLNVLFSCMSSDWSKAVVAQSSNNQDPKNMTSLNATVDTLLPRSFQGSMLEFDVMFYVEFSRTTLTAVCNNLTVGFSPNATEGMMEGGPRLCHVDYCS